MKTFQQYLTESPWGTRSILDLIVGFNFDDRNNRDVKIPISTPMFERILKDKKELDRISAFHITDGYSLSDLINIQHSKKSISCTTTLDQNNFFDGVETGGGVIAKLTGKVFIKSDYDANTFVDEQGRRWIDLIELASILKVDAGSFVKQTYVKMREPLKKFIDNIEKEFFAEVLPAMIEAETKEKTIKNYLINYARKGSFKNNKEFPNFKKFISGPHPETIKIFNEFQGSVIRGYYVATEIQLRKIRAFMLKHYAEKNPLTIGHRINEVVLNEIEIESFLITKNKYDEMERKNFSVPIVIVDGKTINYRYEWPNSFDTENKQKIEKFLK